MAIFYLTMFSLLTACMSLKRDGRGFNKQMSQRSALEASTHRWPEMMKAVRTRPLFPFIAPTQTRRSEGKSESVIRIPQCDWIVESSCVIVNQSAIRESGISGL